MNELRDLRAVLQSELRKLGIEAFIYEADEGARPESPEQVSLEGVDRTDLFVLVIGESHGEITEREYDRARERDKPCLVYQRTAVGIRDVKLERFLEKLSGARNVPSRKAFQTAVDLAPNLAKDIHAWLVREYRRLSAEQSSSRESSRRHSEIDGSIRRLSASATWELPIGTSADLLAWQLQQWFDALGFPLEGDLDPNRDFVDLVVRVPARRKRYTRVLVRAKNGEIRSSDVEDARIARHARSVDEAWLVSFRRISSAAKKAAEGQADVLLYTLDDLIEEDVNFDSYFRWVEDEFQAAGIDGAYVSPAVTVNEVDATCATHAQSQYDDVITYVDNWLEDEDGEHLSLLGEFGTGKSWFSLKYAYDMVVAYRKAKSLGRERPRVPLLVRLREYSRGFKDVRALLTEFVFREHEINIPTFRALEVLNRMGRLLFVFDGFDEMAARVDQQKMVDNFWSLAAVLGRGSKAILTCRTEYFQFAKQAAEVLNGKLRGSAMKEILGGVRFQVATLQMFDEGRLKEVLTHRSGDRALVDRILSNQRLVDLGRRPVMIDLLIEAMPDLKAERADLSHVYYKAVQRKMERDIKLDRTFTSMADKFFFMCEASWEMLSSRQLKIHYKQIPATVREYFGVPAGTAEEDHWRHDLLSQTMLVRDDDGYYRPAHKSLIEFFSAYKLAAEIGALEAEYVEAVSGRSETTRHPAALRWSDYFRDQGAVRRVSLLGRFICEPLSRLEKTWGCLSLDNATTELIFSLCGQHALVESTRALASERGAGKVAARVLEVASFTGDLRSADLSGAVLEGCRLRNCSFSGANLSRSEWSGGALRQVSLDGAILAAARLSKIELTDVSLREADLNECVFEGVAPITVNVVGACWGRHEGQDVLVAVLGDGRVALLSPFRGMMASVGRFPPGDAANSPEEVVEWLLKQTGSLVVDGLGEVSFDRAGWGLGANWTRSYLGPGIVGQFEDGMTGPGGDVEWLHIHVTTEGSSEVRFDKRIFDATDYGDGRNGERLLALSRDGRKIVTVRGTENTLASAQIGSTALHEFAGGLFGRGPDTTDRRGAAFSLSDSTLAICEIRDTIGFWRVNDGSFIGRARFYTPAYECNVAGAKGLPEMLASTAGGGAEGWRFEPHGSE